MSNIKATLMIILSPAVLLSAAVLFEFVGPLLRTSAKVETTKQVSARAPDSVPKNGKEVFRSPQSEDIPTDALGESIRRGKHYLENTYQSLPQYVGAKINCTNCHLNSGTTPHAGPWVGVAARFPQFRSRSAKVDTLTDRVNDCFERSLNGKRLPENSEPMTDMIAYMTWLSKGYQIGGDVDGAGMPKLKLNSPPDLKNGKVVYQNKCAVCHQQDGQGLFNEAGKVVFPPLWGRDSFNIGAGMARLHTAAGYVKKNMPLGQGGSLSDKDAWDVAGYFTTQPRPDFKKKTQDWIQGGKPSDARY